MSKNIFNLGAIAVPLAGAEVIPIWDGTTTAKVTVANLTVGRPIETWILTVKKSQAGITTTATIENGNTAASSDAALIIRTANGDFTVKAGRSTGQMTITTPAGLLALTLQHSTGDLALNAGNLVQGTAAKGVNFAANTSAAGMTSQLLNWYEEGTFTPVLTPSGGSITTNATYTGGTYTRIGNLVTVNACFYVTSVSSPTGVLSITGFPFATASGTTKYRTGTIAVTDMASTLNAPVQVFTSPESTTWYITKIVNGVATAMAADVKAASDIRVSMSYQV